MAQPETVLRAVKKAAEERTSESGQRNAVQATLAQYGYFKLPQLQTFSEGRATVRAYVWLDVGGKDLLLITGPSFTPEVRFARDDEYHDADEYGVFVPATHGGMKEDHRAALERARDRHRGEGKIVGRAEPKRTRKPPPKKPSRPKVRSGMEFRTEGPDFRPRTPEGRFVPAMQKPGYHPRDRPTPQGGQWATPRQEWTAQRSREMKQEAKDIEKQFDRLQLLQHNLHRVDTAALTHDNFRRVPTNKFRPVWEQFSQILIAAIVEPTGDNAGFDFKQLIAGDRFVRRHGLPRNFTNRVRKTAKLIVFEAAIDVIHREKRQHRFFHWRVASALANTQHRGVNDFDAFSNGHDCVRDTHTEILVEVGFETCIDPFFDFAHKPLHRVR